MPSTPRIGKGRARTKARFPTTALAGIVRQVKARWSHVVVMLSVPAALAVIAPHCATWHWSIDLLACFPVQGTLALAVAGAALAIARKWWLAATWSLLAGLGATAILPGWLADNNSPEPVDNPPQIRVLSLNLLHSNIQGQQRTLEVVRELAPELIWCAEYTPAWQQFLSSALPDYPYRCEQANSGSFGAALFSRHPLARAEMLALGHSWAPGCRADVTTPYGVVGFLGVHPPPPGLSQRRTEERNRGLRAIAPALTTLPERRIVCGDYNCTPWNAGFAQLLADANLQPGTSSSWLPSWPADLPAILRVPIDHILVAGKLRVTEARLGANIGSDHLPLFAIVRWLD